MRVYSFDNLNTADLVIDAAYEGGNAGNTSDDPISKLLPGIGNMAGFRYSGQREQKKYIVLYTSGENKDWPDTLDLNTGRFVYYGDNRTPGHELHNTPRKGNLILKNVFEWLHATPSRKEMIPPFFIFQKFTTKSSSRSVRFKGIAVPGFLGIPPTEDLVAIWKTTNNQRFQNYRSTFTVLDIPIIHRKWIDDLVAGNPASPNAPQPWLEWRNNGQYRPLTSEPTTIIRTIESQVPQSTLQTRILETIFEYFKNNPFRFEFFAAKVFQLQDSRVIIDEITRGAIDGGRDAIGRYLLGLHDDPVYAEFALEAKCYRPQVGRRKANSVGVKEVSRLISRLRHRQFGVLVTTSVVARQVYEEVREDRHPVIFICGRDIAEILIDKGYNTNNLVIQMLRDEFPL